jgi:hypothetical protein
LIARSLARVEAFLARSRFTRSEIYGAVVLGLLLAALLLYTWLYR